MGRFDRPYSEELVKHVIHSTIFASAMLLAGTAFAADYTVMAPAAPGGGWDQTARALQQVWQDEALGNMEVVNVPGAGGTVGIAQFASQQAGNPNALMVGGYVMVGAILTNASPVTLDDVTPIARLTGEYEAIGVRAESPIENIEDLVEMLLADPGSVSWAGGSAGGTDHIGAGLFAKAVGADPTQVNYIAFSGGGESLASILGGQVTVGISSVSEFREQVEAGTMRILAVSSEERLEGIDAPTLVESGIDVVLQNWRSVSAPPDLTEEQVASIIADIEAAVQTDTWKEILADRGWIDTFLAGDAFAEQLEQDKASTEAILREIGLVQ
jgi:putative tricarboxylic transport membrane protein